MNKEKALHFLGVTNLIACAAFLPFVLLGFGMSGELTVTGTMFYVGYLTVAVTAIRFMKYSKPKLLLFSLIGWVSVVSGSCIDEHQVEKERQDYCKQLRQDPTCVEVEPNVMECGDEWPDYFSCQGIPK